MSAALKRAVREPLLHFLLIGAALFALHSAVGDASGEVRAAEPERRIVIDEGVRSELEGVLRERNGRAPTRAEVDSLLSDWIDEEVLAREARLRGLDQDDPTVRAHLAGSMARVLRAALPRVTPSEEELRAFFDAHREQWQQPLRVDFTHVFVEGADAEARAEALLEQLRAGASPNGLGDTFQGGRRYRERRLDALRETFGAEFVEGLGEQPIDTWTLRRSRFGLHLVRVDRLTAAADADLERVRLDVLHEWTEARERREVERATAELRARWEIVEE